jgi:hypothetical protein
LFTVAQDHIRSVSIGFDVIGARRGWRGRFISSSIRLRM